MVTSGHVAGLLRVPGRLTVKNTVRIGSSHPGQVVSVDAVVGARVTKGQVIARLDDAEQRAAAVGAHAQLASAELLGLRAEKVIPRRPPSNSDEGSPREPPDPEELLEGKAGDAQLELLHTETEIARRAAGAVAGAKTPRAARDPCADGRHRSGTKHRTGRIDPRQPSGTPLLVIGADPATLRLEVEIDERYVGGILPGSVTFTSPAHGAYAFSGTIREVIPAPTAVRSPAPYLVAIDVANPDGALRPGMSALVDLPVSPGATLSPFRMPRCRRGMRPSSLSWWMTTAAPRPSP